VPKAQRDTTSWATVFQGPHNPITYEQLKKPEIMQDTDALVKVLKTTICGTDLHILGGNVATCAPKTRLGHEGVAEIVEVGSAVSKYKPGDRVVVSCITNCGKCAACQRKFYGHCEDGGWRLGNTIDGMQCQYVRVPHVDTSCYLVPRKYHDTDIESALVMTSDILPTGLEIGLHDANPKKGENIAIVGAGPVGLASLMSAAGLYEPNKLMVVDINEHRLGVAESMGATHAINNKNGDAVQQILDATDGEGVDLIIEAIGTPTGWYICQDGVRAGGRIAMLGVHGKPATINLERLWYRNFSFTAGMVHGYSTQGLIDGILDGRIEANKLITHEISLSEVERAYDMFSNAEKHNALKILLVNDY